MYIPRGAPRCLPRRVRRTYIAMKPFAIQSALFTPSGGFTFSAGKRRTLVTVIWPFTIFDWP